VLGHLREHFRQRSGSPTSWRSRRSRGLTAILRVTGSRRASNSSMSSVTGAHRAGPVDHLEPADRDPVDLEGSLLRLPGAARPRVRALPCPRRPPRAPGGRPRSAAHPRGPDTNERGGPSSSARRGPWRAGPGDVARWISWTASPAA
jgi:hypothetical protein